MGCNSSKSVDVANNTNNNNAPVELVNNENNSQLNKPASRPASKAQSRIVSNNSLVSRQLESSDDQTQPKYKLTYFDSTGRAEITRLIFAVAGIEYEDNRISKTEWPELKSKMPLEQLPVLEFDSKVLVQSIAIARYASQEAGLAGKNSLEIAKADAVVETASELLDEFRQIALPQLRNPTEEKEQILENFSNNNITVGLEKLETLLKSFGSGGYFVGENLTWADLFVHELITNLFKVNSNILENFVSLQENRQLVETNENLKSYLDKRNA